MSVISKKYGGFTKYVTNKAVSKHKPRSRCYRIVELYFDSLEDLEAMYVLSNLDRPGTLVLGTLRMSPGLFFVGTPGATRYAFLVYANRGGM